VIKLTKWTTSIFASLLRKLCQLNRDYTCSNYCTKTAAKNVQQWCTHTRYQATSTGRCHHWITWYGNISIDGKPGNRLRHSWPHDDGVAAAVALVGIGSSEVWLRIATLTYCPKGTCCWGCWCCTGTGWSRQVAATTAACATSLWSWQRHRRFLHQRLAAAQYSRVCNIGELRSSLEYLQNIHTRFTSARWKMFLLHRV